MTVLWPHLPAAIAEEELDRVRSEGPGEPRAGHPSQVYTPVGAGRASDQDIRTATKRLTETAVAYGYPKPVGDRAKIPFDRGAAWVVRDSIDLSWSEAGQRDTWSFIALVALPHLTYWRFGTGNAERWVATDLTRHTWARLWWQAVVFEQDPQVLDSLTESDLNQLLERRTMGGDPRLVCALARAIVDRTPGGVDRRPLIRDVTARLLRRLAFLDAHALDDDGLRRLCVEETEQSRQRLADRGYGSQTGSLLGT